MAEPRSICTHAEEEAPAATRETYGRYQVAGYGVIRSSRRKADGGSSDPARGLSAIAAPVMTPALKTSRRFHRSDMRRISPEVATCCELQAQTSVRLGDACSQLPSASKLTFLICDC